MRVSINHSDFRHITSALASRKSVHSVVSTKDEDDDGRCDEKEENEKETTNDDVRIQ